MYECAVSVEVKRLQALGTPTQDTSGGVGFGILGHKRDQDSNPKPHVPFPLLHGGLEAKLDVIVSVVIANNNPGT